MPALLVRCHYVLHLFTPPLIRSLINRGGEAFCSGCSVCPSITWVYWVCLGHVITLSRCSLTAKTQHCANTWDPLFCYYSELKKKSASLVGFKKKTMIFSALNTMCWNFSTFPTHVIPHEQMDDKHLCMTNQLGQNRDWVSHPSFHIPSSRTYVDSLIVQIKLILRSLWINFIFDGFISFHITSTWDPWQVINRGYPNVQQKFMNFPHDKYDPIFYA